MDALSAPTLGWAIRRTLLALFILIVTVAAAALLLYASIDPAEEAFATGQAVPKAMPAQTRL